MPQIARAENVHVHIPHKEMVVLHEDAGRKVPIEVDYMADAIRITVNAPEGAVFIWQSYEQALDFASAINATVGVARPLCTSDDSTNHQGQLCPIHEAVAV